MGDKSLGGARRQENSGVCLSRTVKIQIQTSHITVGRLFLICSCTLKLCRSMFSTPALSALLPLTSLSLTLHHLSSPFRFSPLLSYPVLRPATALIMQPSSTIAPLLLVLFSSPRPPALLTISFGLSASKSARRRADGDTAELCKRRSGRRLKLR